jgi:hypothetical protein
MTDLIQRLRAYAAVCTDEDLARPLIEAAAAIERLTRERDELYKLLTNPCLYLYAEMGAERDRLRAERDELLKQSQSALQMVSAYRAALESIAANKCCDRCQEAALVAREALGEKP